MIYGHEFFKVGDRVRQLSTAYNVVDMVPAGTLGTVHYVGGDDIAPWSQWSELQVEFDGITGEDPLYENMWPMGYDEVEKV